MPEVDDPLLLAGLVLVLVEDNEGVARPAPLSMSNNDTDNNVFKLSAKMC